MEILVAQLIFCTQKFLVAEALESNQISEVYETPSDYRPAASYIKMGSYKVMPRTVWKEMKNRSKTYIWQDGESFIIVVCNPLWELPFGYSIPMRMTDVSGASNWIRTSGLPGMNRLLYHWAKEAYGDSDGFRTHDLMRDRHAF